MPVTITIGQKWSVWIPGRRQWLLATVTSCGLGKATLRCDSRYGLLASDAEVRADEDTMLTTANLFRFVP